ncbi:MAG: site-specific DNA-methyltransferase [Nitrosopumilus sp. D6]|nr:MAG: site-specific DNA-methyltransferase [Nitrosopumilus sp. D6]
MCCQTFKSEQALPLSRLEFDRIECGDNIDVLSKIDSDTFDITITSPPYRNAIDYSMHAKHGNKGENYRGKLSISVSDYIDNMAKIFKEVHRVTKSGGYCCIVIGNEINKGTLEPLPALLVSRLYEQGWALHEEIVWHKVTGGANRAGSFVQRPYPSYFRANIMHEVILVMRKGENRLQKIEYAFSNINQDVMWKEIANSVWHIAPVPPGFLDHPCPYPEEIPYRLLNLYSNEGSTVLDPFNGAGQTTKVARYLGRKFYGIDIQKTYAEYAKTRLNEEPHIRDESIMLEFERIEGSIPKWKKIPTKKINR